ncbi:SusD/RagB family nutrient-binding outer membrane lipoprotein [Mucilaginibacter sp. UR6-1]|uniref:SusD/RagB family nutrient-binding outer membrane lipoprotein n=1 Tax=Mucilaginibacter sp. UR6-1 TaxID=1435643 RepID=UPI001E5EBCF0|nr:SusD/RagB family nutrient-binding outer membrane lipoprotein [Mucilaginibacter sp. UR6-1]MCC8410894.1 SusD/RagB family nutrient-binding outer membrane lipoprotein [Mucilaginibacter sp. UR6-1]
MKRIKFLNMILLGGALLATTSCNKYLDVNDNPNNPVDVSPDLILPAALAQTAANNVAFNSYGAWAGGYQANAGGYGGFGSDLTYNYSTANYNNLWSSTYSNLNSYQTIINKTEATGPYKNYNAIARIMKAFCYLRLIDVYNDVPYTDALKGVENLTPKYDKAEDIYVALFGELNAAIASLAIANDPQTTISTATSPNSQRIDIITSGQSGGGAWENNGFPTAKWTAFANTLKLKMLVRIREVGSLSTTFNTEKAKLASAAFVTYDVKAQPEYAAGQDGKQNPSFNAYAYTYTGGSAQLTTVPTYYAVGFYDGHKLADDVRGVGLYDPVVTYRNYTAANQLGYVGDDAEKSATGGQFFTGNSNGAASEGYGTIKGAKMAQPLMLAAESYFVQAEAKLFGIIPSALTEDELFARGIRASQRYLLTNQNEALQPDYELEPDAAEGNGAGQESYDYYVEQNAGASKPYLVDLGLAGTTAQKLEAIITQKWIAVNYIHSNEGWSDYRRTGYPTTNPGGNEFTNFASLQSVSTRQDKLPVRVLYPASEYALNAQNVPSGINPFTSRVFYDLN